MLIGPEFVAKALSKPPVDPIGATVIATSTQVGVSFVDPVHMQLPSTQTPFLLQ